jgi:hypothetical protein
MDLSDPKAVLRRYLQVERDALLWKLDGLGERAVRLPRTPTGTSLVGLVKHCANVEIGYFGPTFGHEWPEPDDPCFVPLEAYDGDPQADWYLDGDVSTDQLVHFTRRVWEFADRTIDELPLEAVGRVPWWPAPREVTLHHILVRVTDDLARHAGQADILREQIDSAVGQSVVHSQVPDDLDWPGYVAKLTAIAEQFPE